MAEKILIVDDEVIVRDYLAEFCHTIGYDVVAARDGEDALSVLKKTSPDLIITDIMMPNMNGIELISEIKKIPSFAQIPIIVISAAEDINNIVKCIELGAVDYIAKPFERKILSARIRSSLELSKLRKMAENAKIIDAGDKLVTEMVATFSHHINQPLTVALTDLALYQKLMEIFSEFTGEFEDLSDNCPKDCLKIAGERVFRKIGCSTIDEFNNEVSLCVQGLKESLKDVRDLVIKFKDIVRPHRMKYAGGSNIIDIEESQKKTVLIAEIDFNYVLTEHTDIIKKIGADTILVKDEAEFENKLLYSRPHIAILLTDSLNHPIIKSIAIRKHNKEISTPVAVLTMSGEIKDTSCLIYFDHIIYEADIDLFVQKFESIYCEMLNKENKLSKK